MPMPPCLPACLPASLCNNDISLFFSRVLLMLPWKNCCDNNNNNNRVEREKEEWLCVRSKWLGYITACLQGAVLAFIVSATDVHCVCILKARHVTPTRRYTTRNQQPPAHTHTLNWTDLCRPSLPRPHPSRRYSITFLLLLLLFDTK